MSSVIKRIRESLVIGLILTGTLLAETISAQSILGDARKLTELCVDYQKQNDREREQTYYKFSEILSQYVTLKTARHSQLLYAIKCDAGFPPPQLSGLSEAEKSVPGMGKSSGITTRVPADLQSMVINGLATFMAERAESELTAYGIDRLLSRLDTTDMKWVPKLFPQTARFAAEIKGQPYYPFTLTYLQTVLHQDLRDLPKNFATSETILKDPHRTGILTAYRLWAEIKTGKPLDVVFRTVLEDTNTFGSELRNQVRSASAILSAYRSIDSGYELNILGSIVAESTQVRNIYFQLLQARLGGDFGDEVESTLTIKIRENQALIRFVQNELHGNPMDRETAAKWALKVLYEIAGSQSDLHIVAQRYVEMVLEMDDLKPGEIIQQFIATYWEQLKEDEKDLRVFMLLSGFADVKEPDDMTAFLRANALPIGSSRIKRQSRWNLGVNGYVGPFGGIEQMKGENAFVLGLGSPIGFSASRAKNCGNTWRSVTAFVSLIDLSAVVSTRIGGDDAYYSALRFEHFISPGLGLFYNIQNSPISVGAYGSYVPNLRTIEMEDAQANITKTQESVWRAGITVFVDIPMFTWHNRSD